MKTCPKCKTQQPDDKNFCKTCGSKLIDEKGTDTKFLARKLVFEDKLKADPLNVSLLLEYAKFLIDNSCWEDASLYLYKILTIQENNSEAEALLFQTLLKQGKYEEASKTGKNLLLKNPDDIALLMSNGELAQQTGYYSQALEYYSRVTKVDPNHKLAARNKATVLLKLEREDEAIASWEQVYKLDPTDLHARLYVGIKYAMNNEFKRLVDVLEPLENKFDKNSHEQFLMFLFLAYSYSNLKIKTDKVSEFYDKIVDNYKDDINQTKYLSLFSEIINYLGNAALDKKNFNDATRYFNRLEQLGYSDLSKMGLGKINYLKGCDEFALGGYENSLYFLEKSLSYSPENNEFKRKQEEISIFIKTRKGKQTKKTIIIGLIIVVIAICATILVMWLNNKKEMSIWDVAKKENTFISYQNYLNTYPKGKYLNEAKQFQEEAFWNETQKMNTLEGYDKFISSYGNSKHIKEANDKLEDAQYFHDKKVNLYVNYRRQYPNGKYINAFTFWEPEIDGIENDIVGLKVVNSSGNGEWWTFDYLSEFKDIKIIHKIKSKTNLEMSLDIFVEKRTGEANNIKAIVKYTLSNNDGWIFQNIVGTEFKAIQITSEKNNTKETPKERPIDDSSTRRQVEKIDDLGNLEKPIIFQDNFNDNSINMNSWKIEGSNAYEQDGIMKLEQNVTDHGPNLTSNSFPFNSSNPIQISRRLIVHFSNEYYYGLMSIKFDDGTAITIFYLHSAYNNGGYTPLKDYINMSITQNGATSSEYKLTRNIWDTWFKEVLLIDPKTGIIKYSINDKLVNEIQTNLKFSNKKTLSINFSPAGWWTGHYQYFDDFIITN